MALVSARTANMVKRLRVEAFEAARLLADPSFDVVLVRADEDGVETTLAPQGVVVQWASPSDEKANGEGAIAPEADLTLRRPLALGFDVQEDDVFKIQGARARVIRVRDQHGVRFADCKAAS